MPVFVADDPLTCVVRGTGKIVEDETIADKNNTSTKILRQGEF